MFFYVWLISVSIIPSRSIYMVANGKISFFIYIYTFHFVTNNKIPGFLWLSNIPVCMCVSSSSIYQWVGTDSFHTLAIAINAALYMGMHAFFHVSISSSLGIFSPMVLLSPIMFPFIVLIRNLHTIFHSDCNSSHFH